jgi:hypothetical protein
MSNISEIEQLSVNPYRTMATAGPNITSTVTTGAYADGAPWFNASNASKDDDKYAFVSLTNNASSTLLRCQNFGFSIPVNSTINGITVHIIAKANSENKVRFDDIILLDAAGASGGNDLSSLTYISSTSEKTYTFGGTTETWAISPTVAMVNDTDFGVVIRVRNVYAETWAALIDYVSMEIDYTRQPMVYFVW